ncbi:hypothetical protein [Methanogenium organophilum]|uniref:Uncharacterized protein n=1 Tax=Methanogenium organophilum TaxID=2199 RepID=A0A9X9T725_METOG|nr:hypothetical protein [Methanogenium organophilum]WAI00295.1 hypothetical protein OU421_07585 [Methanogenium organophilum]
MVELLSAGLLGIVSLCFGLLAGIQIAHIHYSRRLTTLAKRSIYSKTIAPVLVAAEEERAEKK